jgi:hypothetical protein
VLTALGGCVIDVPATGTRLPSRSGAAEGNWGDTSGIATSTFSNGSFVTFANDTGNRLAEGSYRYVDAQNVEINFTSLVRQQRIRTNCLLISQAQMNCTSDSGSQFTLTRRSGSV